MKKAISIAIPLASNPLDPITALILEQKNKLFDFIKKRVPEKEDAEDILQDVFFLLVKTSQSMKKIEHITSWLFRVAKNKIVDLYRKKKPEPLSLLGSQQIYPTLDSLEISENLGNDTPDVVLQKKEFWSTFDETLKSLPKKQSEVFIMNEMEGLSFKEISAITGDSVNTLLSRKRYAVLQLRKKMQNFQQDFTFAKYS